MEEYKVAVVQHHERPPLEHVPSEALKSLLKKCWDPVPDYRPTFTQVRAELEDIVGEHRKSTAQKSGRFSFRRQSSRSKSPVARRDRGSKSMVENAAGDREKSIERNTKTPNKRTLTKSASDMPDNSGSGNRFSHSIFDNSDRASHYVSVEDDGGDE
jgi:hypothetical protein